MPRFRGLKLTRIGFATIMLLVASIPCLLFTTMLAEPGRVRNEVVKSEKVQIGAQTFTGKRIHSRQDYSLKVTMDGGAHASLSFEEEGDGIKLHYYAPDGTRAVYKLNLPQRSVWPSILPGQALYFKRVSGKGPYKIIVWAS